jgi:molecular chaperone DnaK (HSP70)
MARAKFSIGIDLGTTNCAMAFEALDGADSRTQVFAIPQWEKPGTLSESATLPSFLYLPAAHEAAALGGEGWVPGRFARKQAAELPGRVVHSAKSWLCHHTVDRSAPFLPWRSDALDPAQRISPVEASAILLQYLRAAWDAKFAGDGAEFRFDTQEITITVPASFDAVAQRLTLDAARQAGFPEGVRLIEEPQAAFYRWLELHDGADDFWKALPADGPDARHVAVIDIGGGTSDFSLFEIARQPGSAVPRIRRVAVSDHLLLGGDNIDLALAHRIRQGLAAGADLAPGQWNFLVAQCRDLKERCLSGSGADAEIFSVSIPGRGSGLLGGTLTARIARAEIDAILMDGFFPECDAAAEPARGQAALREWALPYAADSAVTRYLAEFLRGRPQVDAVLFNGGSLHPAALRLRLQRQIAAWQRGRTPVVLENAEPDLAVARGAARFGSILHGRAARIEAGAARAIYLEVHDSPADGGGSENRRLVCILPRGAEAGEEFSVSLRGLELCVGRPVRFQPFYSTRHDADRAGTLVEWDERAFHSLPPLQTVAKLSERHIAGGSDRLPVRLSATMNELGLLQVLCVSADPRVKQSWPLEFNLRPHEAEAEPPAVAPAAEADPGVDAATLDSARERIVSYFRGGLPRHEKLSANNLLKHLEKILGMPRANWNGALIRSLWPALFGCLDRRAESADHEEAWLITAGFLLRPGFGADRDAARIDELWRIHTEGQANAGKRIQIQQYVTWRRVAGGLSRERQEAILAPELPKLSAQKSPPAELVRLAGALERIEVSLKCELAAIFTASASELAAAGEYCAPFLVALGLLLNRAPLYAGPAAVIPPAHVAEAFDALQSLDWAAPELAEILTLFLRAARVVDDPSLDVPKGLRAQIASRLEKAGVAPLKLEKIRTFVPTEGADQAGLFGESLPPGLVLKSSGI